MSRSRAASLIPNRTCALISISTPGKAYPLGPRLDGWFGVLHLDFHDIGTAVPLEDWLYISFREQQAHQAVAAVREWQAAGVEDLVLHCDAGLSRSVAMAESLRRVGVGSLSLWECRTPLQANELVLRLMASALGSPRTASDHSFWNDSPAG